MSYAAKSASLYATAAILSTLVAAVVAVVAFMAFGAYMPDGVSMTGYIYGVTDTEAIITIAAIVVAFCATMFTTTTVGENHII